MAADETLAAMMKTVRHVAGEAASRGNTIDSERAFPADLFDQLESAASSSYAPPSASAATK